MSATGSCEERHDLKVLVPYDRREAIDVQTAAKIAARGETTIRQWCAIHHIGRRVGGGPWQVSRVALREVLQCVKRSFHPLFKGTLSWITAYANELGDTHVGARVRCLAKPIEHAKDGLPF